MIKVTVIIEQGPWRTHLRAPKAWATGITEVMAASGVMDDRSCTLMLTTDESVQRLNLTFRQKDKPTNILSFPAGDQDPTYLGDMAMAFETCQREALSEGKAFRNHATHLLVHGLLHLLGYDHENDADAEEMEALEVKLLAKMGIENPYEMGEPS
jgi:probable rRNA maturation factor